ncbi:hypothetical protein [Ramlibacter sp. WS9]|uniref:hypothetical protein n=1 Tax=Ramlibacter sp. WS9 TaxID=1882741 RepID=UPI001141D665|nr:hypothetical protein [Ramlibacter sp. WS9]ROZ66214.1 hypothetical protein EEB15_26950 [Ramlibacter sp. WS9]
MKIQHTPYHWVLVALAALLLTLGEAHGQSGAAAVFEGRPAMAGAQGGLGAQAGVAQGGIGVQGNAVAERTLRLGKPTGLDDIRQARRDEAPDVIAASNSDVTLRKDAAPAPDKSVAKDQRSAKKVTRALKRTITRARHGVSEVDTSAAGAGPAR